MPSTLAKPNHRDVTDFGSAEVDVYQMVQGAAKCDCPLYKIANEDLEQHDYHNLLHFVCYHDYY